MSIITGFPHIQAARRSSKLVLVPFRGESSGDSESGLFCSICFIYKHRWGQSGSPPKQQICYLFIDSQKEILHSQVVSANSQQCILAFSLHLFQTQNCKGFFFPSHKERGTYTCPFHSARWGSPYPNSDRCSNGAIS